jgi:hypothetical protein
MYSCFLSADRANHGFTGICRLTNLTYLLEKDARVTGFRLRFEPETARLKADVIFSKWAAYWRRPKKFNGGAEDGATAELVGALLKHRQRGGGVPHTHESPKLFAATSSGWAWNWSSKRALDLILNGIGPGKRAVVPIQEVSPGGTIDGLEADNDGIYVSFGTGAVVELPPTAHIHPWVSEGMTLEKGVPLADIVPRKEYSLADLASMPAKAIDYIVDKAKETVAQTCEGHAVYPVECIAEEDRLGVLNGGKIKSIYAQPAPRKIYMTEDVHVATVMGSVLLFNSKFEAVNLQDEVMS